MKLESVRGVTWTQRTSGWMQPEGEIGVCAPYLCARVDAVTIDGVEYVRRYPDTEGILPAGVTLPSGSNRIVDAAKYLERPEDFPDVVVHVRHTN